MACSYTLGASVADQVRLLAADADCTAGTYRFDDAEIAAFLSLNSQDVRMAAAQALDVLASEWATQVGTVEIEGVVLESRFAAEALATQATELRRQVREGDADATGQFDIAEQVVDAFSYRQRLFAEVLRQSS